jgi:hypothetical protein
MGQTKAARGYLRLLVRVLQRSSINRLRRKEGRKERETNWFIGLYGWQIQSL